MNCFRAQFIFTLSFSFIKNIACRDYYSPCNYPVDPWVGREAFFLKCSSGYLGSKLFCDPDSLITRTEADVLSKLLKGANFSTCFCAEFARKTAKDVEKCSELKSEIAFVRRGTLITDQNERCGIQSIRNLHNLRLYNQLYNFGKSMTRMWSIDRDCDVDLFLVAVHTWIGRDPSVSYLIPILSDKLITLLKRDATKFTSVEWFRSNVTSLTKEIRSYVERLVHSLDHERNFEHYYAQVIEEGAKVPMWAILVISLCILSLPVCILVGNLVSLDQSLKSSASTPDHVTIRMANQRWRAGFGGGLWQGKNNDKGGKTTKASSNIMMFKHFHKPDLSGSGRSKTSQHL